MGDPNPVVIVCRGPADQPHPMITYTGYRDRPIPCPICGRLKLAPPAEDR